MTAATLLSPHHLLGRQVMEPSCDSCKDNSNVGSDLPGVTRGHQQGPLTPPWM